MEDMDLIARVYPVLHSDERALRAIQASPLHVSPEHPKEMVQHQYGHHDRQATETPEECDVVSPNDMPYIELKFSNVPRSRHGITFGRNSNNDVVIPSKRVSRYHFSLTFDEHNRFIVKDLNSASGTEVTYDGEGDGRRCGYSWIVGGDLTSESTTNIIIIIDSSLQFRVVASRHDLMSKAYIEKVDRFRQGTEAAEDLLGDNDLP